MFKKLAGGLFAALAVLAIVTSLPDIKRYIRISMMQGRKLHELSIAISIVEGAEEEVLRQGGGRVFAVHLKLGPLSGVVKEALLFSYGLACEGTALDGSSLLIEDVPLRIYCARCRSEETPISLNRLECQTCGAPAERVTHGDELELTALEFHT